MNKTHNWRIGRDEQAALVETLTGFLAPLRAKVGISQGELANLVGLTRQTISAIESGKRPMQWSTYLSLILFFDYNKATHQMIRDISAFPDKLVERFNNGDSSIIKNKILSINNDAGEISTMIQTLDDEGMRSLEKALLTEYARCKK